MLEFDFENYLIHGLIDFWLGLLKYLGWIKTFILFQISYNVFNSCKLNTWMIKFGETKSGQ